MVCADFARLRAGRAADQSSCSGISVNDTKYLPAATAIKLMATQTSIKNFAFSGVIFIFCTLLPGGLSFLPLY